MLKINFSFLFFFLILRLDAIIGQQSVLDQKITFKCSEVTINEALKTLSEKENISFSYISDLPFLSKKISVSANNEPLKNLLEKLFSGTSIIYDVVNNQIILKIKKQPKQHIISGYVGDNKTGEKLYFATIYETNLLKVTTTNNYGFYSIALPEGDISIAVSYLGYQLYQANISLFRDTFLNIKLVPKIVELNEVTINESKGKQLVQSNQMGLHELSSQGIKSIPSIFGQPDVLRTMQMLPGLQKGNELSGGMFVRGGNGDQNMILLDGVPVYNVNHLFGFFSVFNPDAISSVTLHTGSFPARYGGRLSSILDVRVREGNNKEIHGEGSIGLISSNLTLEGPIIKDRTSFLVSGRRTYWDLVAKPFIKKSNSDIYKSYDMGIYFYDINAKVNHIFSEKSRLFLSFYTGKDRIYTITGNPDSKSNLDIYWGNITSVLRWNYVISKKTFSNITATYSNYKMVMHDQASKTDTVKKNTKDESLAYDSWLADYSTKIDFDTYFSESQLFRYGLSYALHVFKPGEVYKDEVINNTKIEGTYLTSLLHEGEIRAYFEDDINITPEFKGNVGLHFCSYYIQESSHNIAEPRLSFRYLLTTGFSIKASVSLLDQQIQQLSPSSLTLPTDIWITTTKKIKPEYAWQYSLGSVYAITNTLSLTIEAYYKVMNNLIDFKDGKATLLLDSKYWDESITSGKGRAYGTEIMIEKTNGNTTGWIAYTVAKSDRQFSELNNGKVFPFNYDRRNDVSIVLNHKFNDRTDIGADWVYGTGNPISLGSDYYQSLLHKNNQMNDNFSDGAFIENIVSKNNYRLPSYHRLDIGINFHKQKKWGIRTWNISVYNAYAHNNPTLVYTTTNTTTGKRMLVKMTIFKFVPSISYSLKF